MKNGGATAQRGFIFQSIIAMIECLERDDWDEIKMEPETELDKVDFVLRRNGADLSAMQVKSSTNPFGDRAVARWLEKLKEDAPGAEEYCLFLVGDAFTESCREYIREHAKEIKTVTFTYLQDVCTRKIVDYILDAGIGGEVTIDDLDRIDCTLFSKIHRNSIAGEPMGRAAFEAAFRRAIPVRRADGGRSGLPTIRNEIDDPCETFVEGAVRAEDLGNIKSLLTKSRKPLWLHGQGGIGKTELVLRFAQTHPEYEYVFTTYAGSINQTVSKDLFILPGYELGGRKLKDEERYSANYDVLRQYAAQLKREGSNLVLIIDDYVLRDLGTELQEQTELDIHNGFAGVENDLKELGELARTGIRIIITTRVEPQDSDACKAYEIGKMREEDLIEVMAGCFAGIRPHLGDEGVRDKLMSLIRISESWTVYLVILAGAMQESRKDPVEALDAMLDTLGPGMKDRGRYSGTSRKMQDRLEEVLGFIGLSYQEKQALMILTMLPDEGMDYGLYQKLTASNSVQLDRLRRAALDRLVATRIVTRDRGKGDSGETVLLRMHPVIADHARKVLAGRNKKAFVDLLRLNWVNKLVRCFDEEALEDLKIGDKDYRYIPMIAGACSAAEQKLKKFGEDYSYMTEDVLASREALLLCASRMSDKAGYAKDALEYIERAIAVNGPSLENMQVLFDRSYSAGRIFYSGGKYAEAKKYYMDCLQVLNDRNAILLDDMDRPEAYDIDELIQSEDANDYALVFHELGDIYESMGDYAKALEYYGKARAIKERVLGVEHRSTAATYHSIGNVYESLGDYAKALEYLEKARAIKERVLGVEHRSTAVTYGSIGDVYESLGDYAKALEYYGKARAIIERVLGTEHVSTAKVYTKIGDVYESLGNNAKALEYLEKARAIKERVLGVEHLSTAATYNSIGIVYENMGDYAKALEYYQAALNIYLRSFGEDHPETKIIRGNLEKMKN